MSSNRNPKPTPPAPARWALRWHCPRCRRAHSRAVGVPATDRQRALDSATAPGARYSCPCGGHWRGEQVGLDWQPENEDAQETLQ